MCCEKERLPVQLPDELHSFADLSVPQPVSALKDRTEFAFSPLLSVQLCSSSFLDSLNSVAVQGVLNQKPLWCGCFQRSLFAWSKIGFIEVKKYPAPLGVRSCAGVAPIAGRRFCDAALRVRYALFSLWM